MKLPVLKYWLLAKSAINWQLLLIVLLLVASRGYGQEQRSPHDSLIIDIILQDTVWSEMQLKSIGYKVAVGRYTKADSIKIRENKRNTKSSLYKVKLDSLTKQWLLSDIKKNGLVSQYITINILKNALENFDISGKKFESDFSIDFLKIVDKTDHWQLYHEFSSPIQLSKNRYLVYHSKNIGINNGLIEFIIYTTEGQTYEIEKRIIIYNH